MAGWLERPDMFGVTGRDVRAICIIVLSTCVVLLALTFLLRMWPEQRRLDTHSPKADGDASEVLIMPKPDRSITVIEGKLRFDYDYGAYVEDRDGTALTLHGMAGLPFDFELHPISELHSMNPSRGRELTVRVTVEVLAD